MKQCSNTIPPKNIHKPEVKWNRSETLVGNRLLFYWNEVATVMTSSKINKNISKRKSCFNLKFLTYYFHMKTKILADFQICICIPLRELIFADFTDSTIKNKKLVWKIIQNDLNVTPAEFLCFSLWQKIKASDTKMFIVFSLKSI